MAFFDKIRELREDRDFTQKEIADMLGITRQQYQLYESGNRQFKIEHIVKICKFFGVSADYILELPKNLKWPR